MNFSFPVSQSSWTSISFLMKFYVCFHRFYDDVCDLSLKGAIVWLKTMKFLTLFIIVKIVNWPIKEVSGTRGANPKIKCSIWNLRSRILENESLLREEKTKTLDMIGHAYWNIRRWWGSWCSSFHFQHVCLLWPATHTSFPQFEDLQK